MEAQIERLLEPYDWDKEVPEYIERVDVLRWRRTDVKKAFATGRLERDEQGFFRRSTLNPDRRWDYWSIGGRIWNGFINGQRISNDGLTEAETIRVNTRSVQSLLQGQPALETVLPVVVVAPDGEWHESHSLGEFDALMNANPNDSAEQEKRAAQLRNTWRQRVREILARYPDHIAVGLDVQS